MFNNIGYQNNNVNFDGFKNFSLKQKKQLGSLSQNINKNSNYLAKNNIPNDTLILSNKNIQQGQNVEYNKNSSKGFLEDIFGEDTDPITWFLGMIMP